MPIETDKPLKRCKYCGKDVRNLGYHIANMHPAIFDKIDETEAINDYAEQTTPLKQEFTPQNIANKPTSSINDMLKEKIETFFNAKILKMLTDNPEMPLQDMQRVFAPQQTQPTLNDIKTYHDLIYKDEKGSLNLNVGSEESSGGQWLELANNALPLIAQIMQSRGGKNNDEPRTDKEGHIQPNGSVHEETKLDRIESEDISSKPIIAIRRNDEDNKDVRTNTAGNE